MLRFQNKRVLITGAAQGIGFAVARSFLRHEAHVVINDINQEALDRAVNNLGAAVRGIAADISNFEETTRLVAETVMALGGVDILVSNAGIYPSHPFLELTEGDWNRVMDINAKGAFLVSQAVARQMVNAGHPGSIITISSGSARFAREGAAHYCASKAAVVMLTRVMALELARHRIRVNSVSPGLIEIPDGPPLAEEYKQAVTSMVPWGRMGRPQDVANVVLLVADPEAEYLTGQVVPVDGGLSAGRYGIPRSG